MNSNFLSCLFLIRKLHKTIMIKQIFNMLLLKIKLWSHSNSYISLFVFFLTLKKNHTLYYIEFKKMYKQLNSGEFLTVIV